MSNIVSSELSSNSEGFAEAVISRLGPSEPVSSTTTPTTTDLPTTTGTHSSSVEDSTDPLDSNTSAPTSASYSAPTATSGIGSTATANETSTFNSGYEANTSAPREPRRSSLARDHGIDTASAGTTGTSFLPHAQENPSSGLGETTAAGTYLGPGPSAKGWLGKAGPETDQTMSGTATSGERRSSLARDHGVDTASAGTTGTSFLPHADEAPSTGHGETTAGGTYLGPGPTAKGWLGKAGPEADTATSDTATSGERRSSLARDHGIDTASAGTTGTDFIHHDTTDPHGEITAGGTNIGPGPSGSGILGKLEGLLGGKKH